MPLKKEKKNTDETFFVTTTVHYAKELNESHRVPYLTIEKRNEIEAEKTTMNRIKVCGKQTKKIARKSPCGNTPLEEKPSPFKKHIFEQDFLLNNLKKKKI